MELARIETPLKRILTEEGRMQSWLADRLSDRLGRHVSRSEVNRWVHGVHVPKQATREAIADVLGRHIDEVFPQSGGRELGEVRS